MFGLPEDDSHIIADLERKQIWKDLEDSTIDSADDALCILRSNLYGDDCDENKILEAIEYLCDEFSLPLIPYNKKMKSSFVPRSEYEFQHHYHKRQLEDKNEQVKKQLKRLVNELYEEWDTLDTDRINSAIQLLADECGLNLDKEKELKIQRRN